MTPPNIFAARLRTQHVSSAPLGSPADVVRFLGAVQAQDYPGAKWSVGQRVRGATDAAIDQALAAGEILRTHILRPTWHFVVPEDIRWMLALTAPRVRAVCARLERMLELDEVTLKKSHRLIERALRGGNQLTRDQIGGVLERGGIASPVRQRLAQIMMRAELDALVCSGALQGKHQTYALLDERVAPTRALERDAALADLARRFFLSHAPATIAQFAWWSGLTLGDARRGLDAARPQLSDAVAMTSAEWLSLAAPAAAARRAEAYFIPEYDETLIGFAELGITDQPRTRAGTKRLDAFLRPIVLGGKMIGTWRRVDRATHVVLETTLSAPPSAAQSKALDAAAVRYSRFRARPVTLQ